MTHMLIHDPLLLLVQSYDELPHTLGYSEMIFGTFNSSLAQVDIVYKVG